MADEQFLPYRRTQIAEMRPYTEGEELSPRVSISAPDREAGSPRPGDMIARNPLNHDDQWLVSARYFADNFTLVEKPMQGTNHGIHPAPSEFSDAQLAADPILHFFHYSHLPEKLRSTSRMFFILASDLVQTLPRNAERTVALRKLLEAKDAAVRANLPAPVMGEKTVKEVEPELGEPVEVGGHDEDRDGPVKFDD